VTPANGFEILSETKLKEVIDTAEAAVAAAAPAS
jgi:hypothetical protein